VYFHRRAFPCRAFILLCAFAPFFFQGGVYGESSSNPFIRGREYYKKGFTDLAKAEFLQDLEDHPKNSVSHFYLGVIALSEGKLEGAVGHLQRAIALDYFVPGGHYALGICLKKMGDYAKAQEVFARAIKIEPEEAKNYFNWGVCLAKLKRYQEGIYAFKRSLSLDWDNAYSHYNLADLFRLTKDYHQAIIHYDVVLRKKPGLSNAHLGKVLTLEALGRKEEALQESLMATKLFPQDPMGYAILARLYGRLGQKDKSVEYFNRYKERRDQTP
jgi:tetratricopeptide (TPR) repeat protein